MNEEFTINNGKIIVNNGKTCKKIVDYTENVVELLVLENLDAFLKKQITHDEAQLQNLKDERNNKTFGKLALKTGAGVVVCAIIGYPIVGKLIPEITQSLESCKTYFSRVIPMALVMTSSIPIVNYFSSPSKISVTALEEQISYERIELEKISKRYVELSCMPTTNNNVPVDISTPQKVPYLDELKRIKDMLYLRYHLITENKKFVLEYKNGTLADSLFKKGIHKQAIVDFIEYLDINLTKEQESISLTKGGFKEG